MVFVTQGNKIIKIKTLLLLLFFQHQLHPFFVKSPCVDFAPTGVTKKYMLINAKKKKKTFASLGVVDFGNYLNLQYASGVRYKM